MKVQDIPLDYVHDHHTAVHGAHPLISKRCYRMYLMACRSLPLASISGIRRVRRFKDASDCESSHTSAFRQSRSGHLLCGLHRRAVRQIMSTAYCEEHSGDWLTPVNATKRHFDRCRCRCEKLSCAERASYSLLPTRLSRRA